MAKSPSEASIMALQAQAVGKWIRDFERRDAPLTAEDEAWARERLATSRANRRS
jgi:hypothetical protein